MVSLGIDTSNYTTSVAVSQGDNGILYEKRIPIRVKSGAVGIRQSDAFFQHMHHLAACLKDLEGLLPQVEVIVVSSRPRPLEGSYMPVFKAGEIFADTLGTALGVRVLTLSHQEGHLLSGWHEDFDRLAHFNVLHLSGGTTEFLYVTRHRHRLAVAILYETLDISFGQLIDRTGVALGLPFPAGEALDRETGTYEKTGLKQSFKEKGFNLSGIENHLKTLMAGGAGSDRVAGVLFSYLLELIRAMITSCRKPGPVLIIGGVGESRFLRRHLEAEGVYFAPRGLSSDNAVGLSRYPLILEVDHAL